MAGKADRSSAGQTGGMPRRPAAGRPRPGSGEPVVQPFPVEIAAALPADPEVAAVPEVVAIPRDVEPRTLKTQAAYRFLITSGFSGQDAAGLIGYVVGLPAVDPRWSLAQVNRLLFLRSSYLESEWGEAERRPA
jgi:hypothetical protein